MLIIPSLLFAVSFLTKIAVLAAPIPLNDIYFNSHDALFSRADRQGTTTNHAQEPAQERGTFAQIISQYFDRPKPALMF